MCAPRTWNSVLLMLFIAFWAESLDMVTKLRRLGDEGWVRAQRAVKRKREG